MRFTFLITLQTWSTLGWVGLVCGRAAIHNINPRRYLVFQTDSGPMELDRQTLLE